MSPTREDASTRQARRANAVAAAGSVVAEFRHELHQAFPTAPLVEQVWLDRLTGRIADLLLRRKLYAWHPGDPGATAFFVVADGQPVAEAAVAAEIRTRGVREADEPPLGNGWPGTYTLSVIEPGTVFTRPRR